MGSQALAELNRALKQSRNVGVVVPTVITDPNSRPCIRGVYADGRLVVPDHNGEVPPIGTFVEVRSFTDLTKPEERGRGVVFADVRTIAPSEITPRLFDFDPNRPLRAEWDSMRWEKTEGHLLRVEQRGDELIAVLQFRYALVWRDHHDQFTVTFFPVGMWSDWNEEEEHQLVVTDCGWWNEDPEDMGRVYLHQNWDSVGHHPRTEFPLKVASVLFPGWAESGNPRFHIATPCMASASLVNRLGLLGVIR